ncbi:MAG: TetR/AcrR family transcriptional regulator [Lachnospiraceae bacterium]|nr:TetR/AcrR family transcriptional regulator [Lachnospiraceae bacterium]
MYKSSKDRRFQKNKKAIRKAYMELVQEKGYQNVTISDIAEHADINRMTFYAHYDIIEDILIISNTILYVGSLTENCSGDLSYANRP